MTRTSDASTYDDDFFAWTQEQAALLRGLSSTGDIDIAHVAEEIEDLGKRDLREVSSFLVRLLEHLLKIESRPRARDVRHWRVGALNFQLSAKRAFSPGMRRLIDVEQLWREAANLVQVSGVASSPSNRCPFALDELLSDDFDVDAALAKLAALAGTPGG